MIISIVGYAHAQSFFTFQKGKVVYNSSSSDMDSLTKKQYSILCDSFIKENYPKRKLPLVYLVISRNTDSLRYELAYDNLMGNSTQNKDYDRHEKYDTPGIRIKVYSENDNSIEILKMLEYGITHLDELKKLRKVIMKKDYYDQPDNLSISQNKIATILKMSTSVRIKAVLRNK